LKTRIFIVFMAPETRVVVETGQSVAKVHRLSDT